MLTKDRTFYKDFFKIFLLLVLQNVVTLSVNMADNVMLGAYSETALTAAATVNQVQFLLQQIILGVGDGLVVLASQYWGRKDMEPVYKITSIAVRFAMVVVLIIFGIVSFAPEGVIGIFTNNHQVIVEGTAYLSILRFSYLFFGMSYILLAALRTVETVKIAFFLSILTLGINCTINYILIFGKFGFPEMGVKGAAIGTLAARIIEFICVLLYIIKKEQNLKLRLIDYLHIDRKLVRDYFKISTPVIFVCILWGVSTAMQTVILGHLTPAAIAANSIAATLLMMLKSAMNGAASTASVITGRTIGRGDLKKVKEYARTMQFIFLLIGLSTSLFLFLLRNPVLGLYDISDATRQMANAFILVLCVTCIGSAYENPTITGIIRGGGSTRFDLATDMISIWGIVLPLSYLFAFVWKLPPVYVIAMLNADQLFKCIPAFIMVNFGKWIHIFTPHNHNPQEAT